MSQENVLTGHATGAAHRIRIARRTAGLSQAQLAAELGLQRSAVSHWEAHRGKPSMTHLRQLALLTGVHFEWLATGRGAMSPSAEARVDDPMERRLLAAFRDAPMQARVPLIEIAEQLAGHRGRPRHRPTGGTTEEG